MRETDYEIGSTNVYADLERRNANRLLAKAGLVRKIDALLEQQGLSPTKAASYLGVSHTDLLGMRRGQFCSFSERKLRDYLTRLSPP